LPIFADPAAFFNILASCLQERDVSEESGWKLVHGDVFRAPRNLVLLAALVGTGAQLALLILSVILIAIVGMLYVG
jgi:transmembrane 9 superfamily protein 3